MDKAMKALKDRRHIKTRKMSSRVQVPPPLVHIPPKPRDAHTATRDTITADDAGHALMLLRNAKEQAVLHPPEQESNLTAAEVHPEMADAAAQEEERRRRVLSEKGLPRIVLPPGLGARMVAKQKAQAAAAADGKARLPEAGDEPALWQSVIVSRESPQTSLSSMLINAKQRLDALSSIQQAVGAPICLIYPPIQQITTLPAQIPIQQYLQLTGPDGQPVSPPVL